MKRIKRFGIYQTAKIGGVIYFLIAAIIMIPIGLLFSMLGMGNMSGFPAIGGVFFFILPFVYGFIGFVMTALCCAVYNLVAKWTGGIEFEVETFDPIVGSESLAN